MVYRTLISTRGKMTIDVNSDADTVVPNLIPNLCKISPCLHRQARISVLDIMHPDLSEVFLFRCGVKLYLDRRSVALTPAERQGDF